jgi:hypothetical protein
MMLRGIRRRLRGTFGLILFIIVTFLVWKPNQNKRHTINRLLPTNERLSINPGHTFFHTYPDNNRFISGDTWRSPESFGNPVYFSNKPLGVLQQQLALDHVANSENIMLLIKTGTLTVWERMPVHFLTTLTRFPNFAIYSDAADSVAGYEVIDILANVSQSLLLGSDQFLPYRKARELRSLHNYVSAQETDIQGGWTLDKFKNLKILEHSYREAPDMEWYVMIDDDTAVFSENLCEFLSTLNPDTPYYLGSAVAGLEHIFAHGGSGIVLSREAMKRGFGDPRSEQWVDKYTKRAERECCGDYMVAMYLKETIGLSLDFTVSGGRFQGEPAWAVPTSADNWCQEIISLHHQSPRDVELLWEYEQFRRGRRILYRDLYTDFLKPYIPNELKQKWDNGAKNVELSWSRDTDNKDSPAPIDPSSGYFSLDNCRQECESRPD